MDGSLSTWRVHVGAGGRVDKELDADTVLTGVAMLVTCQLCMYLFKNGMAYTRTASAIKKMCRTVDTECIF